jgi:hypothetical protein
MKSLSKDYWASDLPHPLSPSNDDYRIFYSYRGTGTVLLLGCTRRLIGLATDIIDINPWYDGSNVIVQDWRANDKFYDIIMIDGGLCFNKILCDEVLEMASNNCKRFIARSFNHKLDIMKIADYFPSREDFAITPYETRIFKDYSFFIWEF